MKLGVNAFISALWLFSASAASAETVKVGVLPNVYAQSIEALIPEAKAQGLDIQIVEFSDWTTPNLALQSGDIDVNYFQHKPFLDNASKQGGYDFGVAGLGILSNIGLYSLKHKDFLSIPGGGSVAVANDPVNQGRGLLLLQKAGLIKLKDGVGFKATLDDVVENPKNLKFSEVEGPQLVRVTPDVDLAMGYPNFIAVSKAFDAGSGLLYSGVEDKRFAIAFVAQKKKIDDPAIKKLVALYQNSDAVKAAIAKGFGDNPKLYALSWINDAH
jgi:D-methionine transport system substrate-binding protein